MATVNCTNEDKYPSKDGKCCDRCQAGWYVKAECNGTKQTECAECGRGLYTATRNHLNKCHVCKDCSSSNRQRKVKDCTAQEDTVCECVDNFYCSNNDCDHCQPVSICSLGYGVKVKATRMNDTVCAPCGEGTYGSAKDSYTPCQQHTRCADIGRVLKTPGTQTTDAICGDFISNCHWIIPASLWSGLVLTALVLFGLICWRGKRKSYRTASPTLPLTLIEMVPAAPKSPPDLSLPSTELNGYCQESTEDSCNLPLFNPDDNTVSVSTQNSMETCPPITPLKASVSFSESTHTNGSVGYCSVNFLRTYSEPQEDEWCGT